MPHSPINVLPRGQHSKFPETTSEVWSVAPPDASQVTSLIAAVTSGLRMPRRLLRYKISIILALLTSGILNSRIYGR